MPRATAKVIPKCLFDCPSINREVSTTTLVEYSIGKLFCGHAGGEDLPFPSRTPLEVRCRKVA
jgi:hypothetical protein